MGSRQFSLAVRKISKYTRILARALETILEYSLLLTNCFRKRNQHKRFQDENSTVYFFFQIPNIKYQKSGSCARQSDPPDSLPCPHGTSTHCRTRFPTRVPPCISLFYLAINCTMCLSVAYSASPNELIISWTLISRILTSCVSTAFVSWCDTDCGKILKGSCPKYCLRTREHVSILVCASIKLGSQVRLTNLFRVMRLGAVRLKFVPSNQGLSKCTLSASQRRLARVLAVSLCLSTHPNPRQTN